jgi:hypothetical protein
MQILKLKAASLALLVIFSGTIGLRLGVSLPPTECVVPSSGLINYGTRPLHTEGAYIKDDFGNTVFLRGVFKAEFLDTCAGWFPREGYSVGEDGYRDWGGDGEGTGVRDMCSVLRDEWGVNFVGIYIWADWWIHDRMVTVSQYVPTTTIHYRNAIKGFIEIAQQYGIYVMVSVYACNTDEGRVIPMVPYPPQHDGSTFANKEAFIDFYVNSLAAELRDYNNVIFCPFDEPDTGDLATWYGVVQDIIDGIRALPCDNLFLYHWGYCGPPLEWIGGGGLVGHPTLNGTNIVHSGTVYRYHGTFPGNEYLYDDVKSVLAGPCEHPWMGYLPYGYGYQYIAENLSIPLVNFVGAANGKTDDEEYQAFVNTLECWNEWGQGYAAYQWHRSGLMWAIQNNTYNAIQPPNRVGQALIDSILAGET